MSSAARAETLYDKTGAAFSLDHEHDGIAYVRPMVKVIVQTLTDWDDERHEEEVGLEPASYLVAKERSSLFDTPPVAALDADIAAQKAELEALKSEAKKAVREISAERGRAEGQLRDAQRQLADWMTSHRAMMDLGKLLDGKVLYPLSVKENQYHHGREISRIPEMRYATHLAIHSGDFEKGQKWVCKQYNSDSYGSPFQFFDTEAERAAVISAEFESACQSFRKAPNFDTTSYSTGTTLHYGTLMEWVTTHPALAIPDDIKALGVKHDAELVEMRRATLAAELASIPAPAA